MAIGIAVRDNVGITHWARYSEKGGKAIVRELRKISIPNLTLACEGWHNRVPRVNQVRRVSTLVSSVTCMACILRV